VTVIVGSLSISELENDRYGRIEINACCAVALAGSDTFVPEEHDPLPAEVTDPPAVDGTHNPTDAGVIAGLAATTRAGAAPGNPTAL
jgi:hypothetical protein